MEREELISYLRVHLAGGIGAVRFRRLLDAFGSPDRIAGASISELAGVEGIGPSTAAQIHEGLVTVDPEGEVTLAEQAGVKIITFNDPRYPELLRNSPSPPAVLYVKGELCEQDQLAIAVVGTRRASRYGSEQSSKFGYLLAQAGLTVVSGLARGIDVEAHRGALLAGGRTVAVMGGGLASVYPPEHKDLADKIASGHGALISELPMRTSPEAGHFPARNRIIAAMSLGTVVIEAPQRSGALITASLAADFNREVFAVPGPIDMPTFFGSNELIKSGRAKLVSSLEDILDELGQAGSMIKSQLGSGDAPSEPRQLDISSIQTKGLNETERAVWEFLASGPNDIDTICQLCRLSPAEVSAALTMLQIKGLAKQLPGNQYCRSR